MDAPKRELYKNPVNYVTGFKVQEPYPFNERGKMQSIINSELYKQFCRLKSGVRLNREEKDSLLSQIKSSTNGSSGNARLMGMIIPFQQFMQPYLVEYLDGRFDRVYGFDRTSVRNTYHYIKDVWPFPKR